jgi:hypothetical protein
VPFIATQTSGQREREHECVRYIILYYTLFVLVNVWVLLWHTGGECVVSSCAFCSRFGGTCDSMHGFFLWPLSLTPKIFCRTGIYFGCRFCLPYTWTDGYTVDIRTERDALVSFLRTALSRFVQRRPLVHTVGLVLLLRVVVVTTKHNKKKPKQLVSARIILYVQCVVVASHQTTHNCYHIILFI